MDKAEIEKKARALYNKHGLAKLLDVWISEFNQSMQRKEAAAAAMAKVLSEAGISAYPMSRMD